MSRKVSVHIPDELYERMEIEAGPNPPHGWISDTVIDALEDQLQGAATGPAPAPAGYKLNVIERILAEFERKERVRGR